MTKVKNFLYVLNHSTNKIHRLTFFLGFAVGFFSIMVANVASPGGFPVEHDKVKTGTLAYGVVAWYGVVPSWTGDAGDRPLMSEDKDFDTMILSRDGFLSPTRLKCSTTVLPFSASSMAAMLVFSSVVVEDMVMCAVLLCNTGCRLGGREALDEICCVCPTRVDEKPFRAVVGPVTESLLTWLILFQR